MKIYVAGKWGDLHKIKQISNEMQALGLEITSTWYTRPRRMVDSRAALGREAADDIAEVGQADAVLAILDDRFYAYRGTFAEIGCALGQRKRVVVVCPGSPDGHGVDLDPDYSHYCMTNVFFHHPAIEWVATVNEAACLLKK